MSEELKNQNTKINSLSDKPIKSTIMTILIFLLVIVVGSCIGFIVDKAIEKTTTGDFWTTFALYMSTTGLWIAIILWCVIRKNDRDAFYGMTLKAKGTKPIPIIIGLLIGFGTNFGIACIAQLLGSFKLHSTGANVLLIAVLFIAVMVQSGSEEIICRGFVMTRLKKTFPNAPLVAVLGNAVLFMALHLFNPGMNVLAVLALLLVGVAYSFMTLYFDSLWPAILCHTGWNFTQAILLGLPNSGNVTKYSLFAVDGGVTFTTNSLAYDRFFGIEATVISCLVNFAVVVVFCLLCWKKGLLSKKTDTNN